MSASEIPQNLQSIVSLLVKRVTPERVDVLRRIEILAPELVVAVGDALHHSAPGPFESGTGWETYSKSMALTRLATICVALDLWVSKAVPVRAPSSQADIDRVIGAAVGVAAQFEGRGVGGGLPLINSLGLFLVDCDCDCCMSEMLGEGLALLWLGDADVDAGRTIYDLAPWRAGGRS